MICPYIEHKHGRNVKFRMQFEGRKYNMCAISFNEINTPMYNKFKNFLSCK